MTYNTQQDYNDDNEVGRLRMEVACLQQQITECRAEALVDALHPEFGTEWQAPDGMLWKMAKERDEAVAEVDRLQSAINEFIFEKDYGA